MQPNTLHAVLTITDSLCHGGHFLATSCLDRTVYAAIHSFFEGNIATNIDHPSIQGRMNSMACFFYRTLALNQIIRGGSFLFTFGKRRLSQVLTCSFQITIICLRSVLPKA
jgi:hypothetical protein